MTIALPARAKLNLDLAVLGRRDDGFHDVRTTMQAVDLHDLITITPSDRTHLTTSGIELSNTNDNSGLKALTALESATNQKLPTRIHIHKRIPPGAGLGGPGRLCKSGPFSPVCPMRPLELSTAIPPTSWAYTHAEAEYLVFWP